MGRKTVLRWRQRKIIRYSHVFIILFITGLLTLSRGQIRYVITDIGSLPLGSGISVGYSLNNLGHVVGGGPSIGDHGFFWSPESGMVDLGDLPGGVNFSSAKAISDSGTVVGESGSSTGMRAFLWRSGSGLRNLGDLPGGTNSSSAYGVNASGTVVGVSGAATGPRAFVWDDVNGMVNLGDLPGGLDSSIAYGISHVGQIVGAGTVVSGTRAFRWTVAGFLNLGDLPGGDDYSVGLGITSQGYVVGQSGAANGRHGFRWTILEGLVDIGDLSGGSGTSAAYSANEAGVIVGYSTSPVGNRAVRWDPRAGLVDLNLLISISTPGWVLLEARGINNRGQICGSGIINGSQHAFLATPIPQKRFATSFEVQSGYYFSGDLNSLVLSDDDRLSVFPEESQLTATIDLQSLTSIRYPTEIQITIETSAGHPALSQLTTARNWSSNSYYPIDTRVSSTSDFTIQADLGQAAPSYVSPNGELEIRLTWAPINDEDPREDGWLHSIDYLEWSLTP